MKVKDSIRKRIILSYIILSISPIILLGGILLWQIFSVQRIQAENFLSEISKLAAKEIVSIIEDMRDEMFIGSKFTKLVEMDLEEQYRILSKIRSFKDSKHQDITNEISLLDSKGRETIRISRSDLFTADDLRERSGTELFIVPSISRETYYSPVYFDEESGNPMLTISIPVIDAVTGTVGGVLASEIRLKFIWEMIGDIKIGETGTAYILNADGRVVAHPDPSVVLRGTLFSRPVKDGLGTGLNGTWSIIVSENIQIGQQVLYLLTEIPVSEALKLTKRSLYIIAAFLLLTLSGAFAFGYISMKWVIKPVESLSKTANSIISGNLYEKATISSKDEIGILSNTFNVMTAKLTETIQALKLRIVERDSAYKEMKKEMSERIKAEISMENSHERLLMVLNSLNAVVYVADMKTYEVLFINKYTRDVFGDIEGNICWQSLQSGQSAPCEFCTNDRLLDSDGNPAGAYNWEFQNTVNGRWYYLQDRAIRWVDDRLVRIEIATDITDRKMVEHHLKSSLDEKELLLREIHHRVKNNMQVISSLLSLQANQIEDKQYVDKFNESKNRIKSMALVHEKLYQSKDMASIDFNDYITSLAKSLFQFHESSEDKITLKINAEAILLGIDTAIPCGLIINELLSNCLKHAFPGGRKGNVTITLSKTENEENPEYNIIVSDDGIGIPENFDIRNTSSLGMELVFTLVEHQLQGTLNLDRTNGTEFRIMFHEIKYTQRT